MSNVKVGKSKQIDMLNGSLIDKILVFAIPIALSSILQQMFNAVDVAVVGRFASSTAQAAVGGNGALINLLLNLFIGISVGANVVIAKYIGQGRTNKIKGAVHTAMLIAVLSGIILLFLGISVAKPILELMGTPYDVIDQAVVYLRIYFAGMPFIMVYNFGASILRSIGDTKRPLICLIVAGITNAIINLTLVIVFHMGVAGVGIGTVVSNMISSSMVVYFLIKEKDPIKLYPKELKIHKIELLRMLKIGIPAGLQAMVFSVANVFIQAELNKYGSDAVAGSAAGLNYEYIAYFMISAFNQATMTFTSQNFGAKKYDRCKKIYSVTMTLAIVVTIVMCGCFLMWRGFFIGIFTSEPKVAHYAAVRMTRLLSFYFLIPTYEIAGSTLRGMGYSMTPAVITVFGTCVFRLAWIYTVCRKFKGFEVLMNVYPVSWVITGALVLISYYIIRRKVFNKKGQNQRLAVF